MEVGIGETPRSFGDVAAILGVIIFAWINAARSLSTQFEAAMAESEAAAAEVDAPTEPVAAKTAE